MLTRELRFSKSSAARRAERDFHGEPALRQRVEARRTNQATGEASLLRDLLDRGLEEVQLVISDVHEDRERCVVWFVCRVSYDVLSRREDGGSRNDHAYTSSQGDDLARDGALR